MAKEFSSFLLGSSKLELVHFSIGTSNLEVPSGEIEAQTPGVQTEASALDGEELPILRNRKQLDPGIKLQLDDLTCKLKIITPIKLLYNSMKIKIIIIEDN